MTNDKTLAERIAQTAEAAQEAFWAEVAKNFPEAVTGDFDPMALHHFDERCKNAVKLWVMWNVPEVKVGE
jgi:hypothetical protein